MNEGRPEDVEQREFARIDASIPARVQPLDESRARRLKDELCVGPSVWSPSNESTIREMASGSSLGSEAILARAVLELTSQLVQLQARDEGSVPVKSGWISQLSGGGGRLQTEFSFDIGDRFEMRFTDDQGDDIPPIRALCEVVHKVQGQKGVGFRFAAIHPSDQTLLMRLIYRIQRQELRRSHMKV